ncbi:MAG TPA: hypothetical protein VKX49_12630 [Bryobacteraceae bacterium]|nr:hypothetical protein [Bryobacteraceae bacterium]
MSVPNADFDTQDFGGSSFIPEQADLYIILTAPTLHALEAEVQTYFRQGWTPQGGVAVSGSDLYQAMIRPR